VCATGPFVGYTAKHVADGAGSELAWLRAVGEEPIPLEVMVSYKDRDLVRVMTKTPFPVWAPLRHDTPPKGTRVHLLGPALGNLTLWHGEILGRVRVQNAESKTEGDRVAFLGTSPAGSSGGCVWDEDGQVLGVISTVGPYWPNERTPQTVAVISTFEPLYGGWSRP
jgi:hypothetical protein